MRDREQERADEMKGKKERGLSLANGLFARS